MIEHLVPKVILEHITIQDAFIAIYILTTIAAIEAGIIGGLATRVGSLRQLFRMTAMIANNRTNKKHKKVIQ